MTKPGKTILLVEDQDLIASLEMKFLREEGYNSIHTPTGELAIKLVNDRYKEIDLILMDIDLGDGIDGLETAREIQKNHDIPILFLTSHPEKEPVVEADEISSYGYVIKDSNKTILSTSIRMTFKLHKAYKELNEKKNALIIKDRAIETALNAIAISDLEGNLTYINPAFLKLWGFHDQKELIGSSITNFWQAPSQLSHVISILHKKGSWVGELSAIRKDGVKMDVIISANFIIDRNGKPLAIQASFQEVTDYKKTEQREKNRNNILESLTSGIPLKKILELITKSVEEEDPTAICSILLLEGNTIRNGAAPRLPEFYNNAIDGLQIGEGVGSCGTAMFTKKRVIVEDIMTHHYWAPYKELAEKAGLRSCWSEPIFSTNGDVLGSFAVYHERVSSPKNEDIERISSAAHFTSIAIERKKAEEAKQVTEEYINSIIENIPNMIFVKDAEELRFVRFNKAGEELLGFKQSELIGKNDYDFFPESEADFFTGKDREVLKEKKLLDIEEEKIQTKLLGDRILHTKKIPIFDGEGNPKYLLGISEDITEKKRTEAALKESLKEKEILFRELQHRVKNNLTVISNLLEFELEKIQDESVVQIFMNARSRIQSMKAIYEQLNKSNSLDRVQLDTYIQSFTESLLKTYAIKKDKIKLTVELENIEMAVNRAIPIGIILNEIVTNALKYAFPGDRPGNIHLDLHRAGDTVTLKVMDNGVGFPEGFDPGSADTLGLLLIKMLVKQIQGKIQIESKNGIIITIIFNI